MAEIWLLIQILMINLVLSGDNAVVIALASKDLPPRQRKQAVWWGSLGAVILRCVLTFLAVLLLQIPYVQAAGGLLLFWIAMQLILEDKKDIAVNESPTIGKAIRTILAADFVMSLDNVLAIAGLANGDLALTVIGIAISIPIVVWGSNMIVKWLHKYPILVVIGAGILAYTSGEMLNQDKELGQMISAVMPAMHYVLPAVLALFVMGIGGYKRWRSAY